MTANSSTGATPSAISPITLAKPIMRTSIPWRGNASVSRPLLAALCTPMRAPGGAAAAGSSIACRTFSSSSRATWIGSTAVPCASWSSTMALTRAPERSFATRRPMMPALRMLSRTRAMLAGVGVKSAGTTLPASMPSSTTSR